MMRKIALGLSVAAVWSFGSPCFAFSVPETHAAGDWMCPCPGGEKPLGSASSCEEKCYGSSAPSRNYEAERQAQEAAAAAAEAERQRRADIEEQRKVTEEKLHQEEVEREAEFLRQRDSTVLRGSSGIRITPNASGGKELRGSASEPAARGLRPAKEAADLGGKQAAWKQLNCAAAISGYAFAALSNVDKPDYEEFRNLTGEALTALNGGRPGVECPAAPAAPPAYGKGGAERVAAQYKALVERGAKLAEDLARTRVKRQDSLDKLIAITKAIADPKEKGELDKLRAAREKLAEAQDKEYAHKREEQRKINEANQRAAEELKKRALAEALAAQRTSHNEYGKNTEHESRVLTDLKKMKEAADAVGSGKADALKRLQEQL
ncbi:MAG: hypothetical protein PHS14_06960 [Elusimicrobia bacterium]|nr:hypothetical protein [Elusimicrobiota bacterium]